MDNEPSVEGGDNEKAVAVGQLRSIVERIERLEEDKSAIAEDIKEVKAEAKSAGFDMKALAEVLKLRKLDKAERQERESLREMYCEALGVFG